MAKRIIVICRQNQARSVAASAALRRFFPGHQILSAGTVVRPKAPIPSSILEILREWNLYHDSFGSTLTTDLTEVGAEDFILCADAEVKSLFVKQLNINLNEFTRIHILEEFAKSKLEIPIDPASLDIAETKIQLARSIVLATRATRKFLECTELISDATLPETRQEHLSLQDSFTNSSIATRLMIDTGFSIPDPSLWLQEIKRVDFSPTLYPDFGDLDLSGRVLTSQFEVDNVARFFLSSEYFKWIAALGGKHKVALLSQPYQDLPVMRKHEAILSLIHS
jgi:protein-tyrosine-phosphatase